MSRLQISVLTTEDIERIHKASVELLNDPGVDIGSPKIYNMLLENGAARGKGQQRVRIDESMVKKALSTCLYDYEIAFLNGKKKNIRNNRHYSTCLVDPKINDCSGGNVPPVLKDCADAARLLDAIETVTIPYKMDLRYTDVPDEYSVLQSNLALFENFTRHVMCGPINPQDAQTWVDMAEIMAPGPLGQNPVITMIISPSSPLSFHNDVLEMLLVATRRNLPVICLPCPMCGLTSPVSIAGTLAMLNAENLMLIVVTQMLNPGNPMVYHTVAMPVDTRYMIPRLSAPEKMLMTIAASQIGHYYGIPSAATASSTDVSVFDIQNGAESMSQIFPSILSEADIITGIGSNSNACGTSLSQILCDLEFIRLADRFAAGINLGAMDEALSSIREVSPGGNFVNYEHTIDHLLSGEIFTQDILDWTPEPKSDVSPTKGGMLVNAREKARNILNSHRPKTDELKLKALRDYVTSHIQ